MVSFFLIFTPSWGRFPIWQTYFSSRLKPPTREPENDGLVQMIFLFQGCILRFHVNLPGCRITGEPGWTFREATVLFLSFFGSHVIFSKKTIPSGNLTFNSSRYKNSPSKSLKKKHPKWWDFDFPANIYMFSLPGKPSRCFSPPKNLSSTTWPGVRRAPSLFAWKLGGRKVGWGQWPRHQAVFSRGH